ncbi:MAG: histidinol-phosphate transaminase [Spirochaetes bacterium]|nr:histidinol-phosphate transaminase [Spirochaetota bacterium]
MNYWNKRLTAMTEYVPGEQPDNVDRVIKLNTNESPFPPSKAVLEAIGKEINGNLRFYPDPTAREVRELFAAQNGLTPESCFVANGSDEIFTLLFRGFIEPEGTAAFPYPSYSLYYTMAEMNGIAYEKVGLEKDFSFDLKKFLKRKYQLVILSNPNNPTGTYCDPDEIRRFLEQFRGLLVVDEAYIDFYGGSSVELVREYDNLIVTRSFSKSYSLAGMRIGIAAADPAIIRGFWKLKDSYNVNRLSIAAARAALADAKGFNYNRQMVVNNKEYLEERLTALGFELVPSRSNFILARHTSVQAKELYERLRERGILVRYFDRPVISEYVRISVGAMMHIKTLCGELEAIVGGE